MSRPDSHQSPRKEPTLGMQKVPQRSTGSYRLTGELWVVLVSLVTHWQPC